MNEMQPKYSMTREQNVFVAKRSACVDWRYELETVNSGEQREMNKEQGPSLCFLHDRVPLSLLLPLPAES